MQAAGQNQRHPGDAMQLESTRARHQATTAGAAVIFYGFFFLYCILFELIHFIILQFSFQR